MNPSAIVGSGHQILGDLDAVRQNWKWVLAPGIVFVILGTIVFGYSVLVTLASVFVSGWALVFGGIFQAICAFFKVFQWSGFLLELLLAILYVVVGLFRIFADAIFHPPGRAWLLLSEVVTLLLSILIWTEWPGSRPNLVRSPHRRQKRIVRRAVLTHATHTPSTVVLNSL